MAKEPQSCWVLAQSIHLCLVKTVNIINQDLGPKSFPYCAFSFLGVGLWVWFMCTASSHQRKHEPQACHHAR